MRWVKQQTRWSKSFFREAFWFPTAFARHSFWLTVETTKQTLYPFILIATVLHFLYYPTSILRPISWLATMFGVAFIKSLFAVVVERAPRMLLFSFYGLFYFFGLLPSVGLLIALTRSSLIWQYLLHLETVCHSHHGSDHVGDVSTLVRRDTQG